MYNVYRTASRLFPRVTAAQIYRDSTRTTLTCLPRPTIDRPHGRMMCVFTRIVPDFQDGRFEMFRYLHSAQARGTVIPSDISRIWDRELSYLPARGLRFRSARRVGARWTWVYSRGIGGR